MKPSPYRVDKLAAHPDDLAALREGLPTTPITVHLMPANRCPHSCEFCSYRLPMNKNSVDFDAKSYIPWDAMERLLDDFEEMGVQGIEVTGGGEPMVYPHTQRLWERLAEGPFDTALVTNGTALGGRAPLVTKRMKWARVSIDAADKVTYARMRLCKETEYELAWNAVRSLRDAASDPDFRLGVGFVLSNENLHEVYDFVERARRSGADNCRLSLTFSDDGLDYFEDRGELEEAVARSMDAEKDFSDDGFTVHNLIPERFYEVAHPRQDYVRCPTKDLLCVVEGECKVYTCCTLTGSLKGCYGKFTDHPQGFKGLWEDRSEWRKDFDASKYCDVSCLYRARNLAMNSLIDSGDCPDEPGILHGAFI